MKNYVTVIVVVMAILLGSCTKGQQQTVATELSAAQFADKIKELPDAPVIDVRTPEEYSGGHLANAKNFDWNGSDFEMRIAALDKSKPVLIYCLSGGRSASAADRMRSLGFRTVYELDGGILAWRRDNLPEITSGATASSGMTKQQFEALLDSDKMVLVDFYAEWCGPCKKMKPYLDEISRDMSATVTIVRIDADKNPVLCSMMGIEALPTLQLYRNNNLIWANVGFIEKSAVVKRLQ